MVAAATVWAAVAVSRGFGWWGLLLTIPALASGRPWLVVLVIAGLVSGVASATREAATLAADVPEGRATIAGALVDDPRPYGDDYRARLDPSHLQTRNGWEPWPGPRLAVILDGASAAVAGERVAVTGTVRARPGRVRGDPVAGVLAGRSIERLSAAADPLFRVGNLVRRRVGGVLEGAGAEGALLAGFLVGDTERLPARDVENLRRAGLSHFVAVSGSNVALFLAAWFLAAGPLGWGPRRRVLLGLVGLALFLVVTRWEPSVVRASLMASLVLAGRVAGIALTPWMALGGAATLSLLIAGHLTADAGFQLSVAATAGVLIGGRWVRSTSAGFARRALGITLGAQAAVAPLLLWHFGEVPLFSPVTNLVAAPVVTLATAVGGAAVITGWPPILDAASWLAGVVMAISRAASGWPQLGIGGVTAAVAVGVAFRIRPVRPLLALVAAAAVSFLLVPAGRVPVPTVIFLDIGQGDATLLLGSSGESILIDGGPDPGRLLPKLESHGVDHFDLIVATHGDQDHIGGLAAALDSYAAGRLWHPGHRHGSELYAALLGRAGERGVPVEAPGPGWIVEIGEFWIEVLGPERRYADINNESIVLRVVAGGVTTLLTGDIEAVAQGELGPVSADVLKVPHHGAATTDLRWLSGTAAPVAVISVGPNDFGHPHPAVLAVLAEAGSDIRRTDEDGDVVIPLSMPP